MDKLVKYKIEMDLGGGHTARTVIAYFEDEFSAKDFYSVLTSQHYSVTMFKFIEQDDNDWRWSLWLD